MCFWYHVSYSYLLYNYAFSYGTLTWTVAQLQHSRSMNICGQRWILFYNFVSPEVVDWHWMQLVMIFSFVKLCDLYENDSIFDKFECCLSGDGMRVATGSYRYLYLVRCLCCCQMILILMIQCSSLTSNLFRVFGRAAGSTEATTLEASKNPMRYSHDDVDSNLGFL